MKPVLGGVRLGIGPRVSPSYNIQLRSDATGNIKQKPPVGSIQGKVMHAV